MNGKIKEGVKKEKKKGFNRNIESFYSKASKISKYLSPVLTILTLMSIICAALVNIALGISNIVRSTVEYTAYLKNIESDIKLNKQAISDGHERIKELERASQVEISKVPPQVKEDMNLSAFTKKSLSNNLSDDQFKQAIKTVENSTTSHQASIRLQESGLFAKADLNEIFAPAIMKQENAKVMPTDSTLSNKTLGK